MVTAVHGTIAVAIPAGTHRLQLTFQETPPRIAGRAVSLLTLVAVAALGLLRRSEPAQGSRNSSGN